MIILVGKSGSGKDTVQAALAALGISPVTLYTTRPPREGEADGRQYWFLSDKEFQEREDAGLFACTSSFTVASGDTWHYAIPREGLTGAVSVQANPGQLDAVKEAAWPGAFAVYLLASDETLTRRRLLRGAEPTEEIARRLDADRKDFAGMESRVHATLNSECFQPAELASAIFHMHFMHT